MAMRAHYVITDGRGVEAAALIDTGRRLLAIFSWHFEGYAHRAALRTVLARARRSSPGLPHWPGLPPVRRAGTTV